MAVSPTIGVGRRREGAFVATALVPIFVLVFIFSLLPVVLTLGLAFCSYRPVDGTFAFEGLHNLIRLADDDLFLRALANTLGFVVTAVALNLLVTHAIALMAHGHRRGAQSLFRTVFFLPVVVPLSAAAIIWLGLLNPQFGLPAAISGALGKPTILYVFESGSLAMPAIVVITLWADMGYNLVILMAGLDGIPRSFYEAAEIDGAGSWYKLRRITLPLLSGTTSFVLVATTISYLQVFVQVDVTTKGGPDFATEVVALRIIKEAFRGNDPGYASAVALVLFIIVLAVSLVQLRLTRRNWEY